LRIANGLTADRRDTADKARRLAIVYPNWAVEKPLFLEVALSFLFHFAGWPIVIEQLTVSVVSFQTCQEDRSGETLENRNWSAEHQARERHLWESSFRQTVSSKQQTTSPHQQASFICASKVGLT
jgi:hypothetical protein